MPIRTKDNGLSRTTARTFGYDAFEPQGENMCNCTKELENGGDGKLAEWVQKKHKATIKSAEYREIAFPLVRCADGSTKMQCVTYSTLRITTNEKKRPVDCTILHSYCPFCGAKYD